MLPTNLGLAIHALGVGDILLLLIIIEAYTPEGPEEYISRKQRPPKSRWIKAFSTAFNLFNAGLEKTIMNIKVRRRYQPRKLRTCGRRTRQKKQRRASLIQVTNMTSTWSNPGASTRPPARQFDSDSHALMLDDGASACITNCKEDFVEPPKRVDRKVKGKKGHADATHRGTLKWYLQDDAGLVHVLIIQGAYLIPDAATRKAKDLRQTHKTEETAPSIPHPGHQHDLNLVQPRGLHSSSSQAIRLRFARPDAGRWGIGLHHQLQGRLRGAP